MNFILKKILGLFNLKKTCSICKFVNVMPNEASFRWRKKKQRVVRKREKQRSKLIIAIKCIHRLI